MPPDLLRSLEKRRVRVTAVTDPYTAMAHLCLFERSRREGDGPFFLIMVSPASLPAAADVVQAVERYASHAVCWLYEQGSGGTGERNGTGANPRLRRIVPEDVQSWTRTTTVTTAAVVATPARSGGPGSAARPALRLAGVEDDEGGTDAARAAPAEAPGRREAAPTADVEAEAVDDRPRMHPILSNEELAMLLDDDVRAAAPATPMIKPRPRSPRPGGS